MVGFDTSPIQPSSRELWSKKMEGLQKVFQSESKLFAVKYDGDSDDDVKLLEIDPRSGDCSRTFSLEGYVSRQKSYDCPIFATYSLAILLGACSHKPLAYSFLPHQGFVLPCVRTSLL